MIISYTSKICWVNNDGDGSSSDKQQNEEAANVDAMEAPSAESISEEIKEDIDEVCVDCPDFEMILGAHLANENDWIGHATITLDTVNEGCIKTGRITRGYWPKGSANFSDPNLYTFGVDGIVLDDSEYYPGPEASHPLFAQKTFKVSCKQIQAAMNFIEARESNPGKYQALTRQSSTFAIDVLSAAGQKFDGGTPTRPGYIHNQITGEDIAAGHKMKVLKDLGDIASDRASSAYDVVKNAF